MAITIDFNASTMVSNYCLGHIGEHNATELQITVPSALSQDQRTAEYRVVFGTNGHSIISEAYTSSPITLKLWQQLTQCPRMSIQVKAYAADGSFIGMSKKLTGFYFEQSITDSEIETDGENHDVAHEMIKWKNATASAQASTSASVSVSTSGSNVQFSFGLPQGETGATGPQGPQGIQGPQGETGAQGAPGVIQSVNGKSATTVTLDSTDIAHGSTTISAELLAQSQEIANINTELAKKGTELAKSKYYLKDEYVAQFDAMYNSFVNGLNGRIFTWWGSPVIDVGRGRDGGDRIIYVIFFNGSYLEKFKMKSNGWVYDIEYKGRVVENAYYNKLTELYTKAQLDTMFGGKVDLTLVKTSPTSENKIITQSDLTTFNVQNNELFITGQGVQVINGELIL